MSIFTIPTIDGDNTESQLAHWVKYIDSIQTVW